MRLRLYGHDFDVGLDRTHEALDPRQGTGKRTRTTAARPLVVHFEQVALETYDEEVAAIALGMAGFTICTGFAGFGGFAAPALDLLRMAMISGAGSGGTKSARVKKSGMPRIYH